MQVVGLRIMWILWSTSSLCLPLPRSNKEHTILKQRQRRKPIRNWEQGGGSCSNYGGSPQKLTFDLEFPDVF